MGLTSLRRYHDKAGNVTKFKDINPIKPKKAEKVEKPAGKKVKKSNTAKK